MEKSPEGKAVKLEDADDDAMWKDGVEEEDVDKPKKGVWWVLSTPMD